MSKPPSVFDNSPMAAVPLISFRPPPDVQRAIAARGSPLKWTIHAIEWAAGPVNLDNYRIKILRLPREKGLDSLEGLFKHIRLNLNNFLPQDKVIFSEYDSADLAKWRTDSPLGAVMRFDFGNWVPEELVRAGYRPAPAPLNLDDGSVVCSSYSKRHWTFSTVFTGGDMNHPVSGNRQFGCYELSGPSTPDDGAYIYTRAADRITDVPLLAAFLKDVIFSGGHETWLAFQQKVARFVEGKGGKASVLPPFSERHDWGKMKAFHKPTVEWVVNVRPATSYRATSYEGEIPGKI